MTSSNSSSKKTTVGMLLVVILASSFVISNMVIFSAANIAKKADDLSVRMEVVGQDIVAMTQGKNSFSSVSDIFEYALVAPVTSMVSNIGFLTPLAGSAASIATTSTNTSTAQTSDDGNKQTSWSPDLVDSIQEHVQQSSSVSSTDKKFVIIAFDDGWKSQYEHAKPILDKYDFKATFFIVCDYVGNPAYMSWREIRELHNSGHDIQSHSMTHKDLTRLSQKELDYELGQSKQCLRERGIEATVFATPHNLGWDNATVIETISRYYNFAKNGNHAVMYLHCDGWKEFTSQTDCRTYASNGSEEGSPKQLTFANRYSIRTWSHNYYDSLYHHNDTKTFEKFVETINAPFVAESDAKTSSNSTDVTTRRNSSNSVVVLEYHKIDGEKTSTSTSSDLFESEMRYLFDNGFSVLTMDAFGYDEDMQYLIISPR